MFNPFKKLFGSRNERLVKSLMKTVARINALEPELAQLSDQALAAKTAEFRERLAGGATLDDLLPEAFGVVREAGKRVLGMRHFDVQLVGGMVLNSGKIAEMRTGEGKTLVATLAAYLNALPGQGVHVVTVNDYLARRDAAWMGRLYHFLGLSVGVINSSGGLGPDMASYLFDPEFEPDAGQGYRHLRPCTRRETYGADITYGTNNEYGFDYLRDNMAFTPEQRVQRDPCYAIVDEVDSILIDEARTPLIISGPSEGSTDLYKQIDKLIPRLTRQAPITNEEGQPDFGPGDFSVDEKIRQVYLSEEGHEKVEQMLVEIGVLEEGAGLYDPSNIVLMHHVYAALRAHTLFQRNVEYIVRDGQVIIVDEFTGRTMPGRRWSEGLHQAVEAKEGVAIQPENQTMASITFQNLLPALSQALGHDRHGGYRGLRIPADLRPGSRRHPDQPADGARRSRRSGLSDPGGEVRGHHRRHRRTACSAVSRCWSAPPRSRPPSWSRACSRRPASPTRCSTPSSTSARPASSPQAGRPGAVTIATNMAGRGTDIVLGGNLEAELRGRRPERGSRGAACGLEGASRAGHRRPAVCMWSAPSVTSRGVSTTSCAVVRAVRAIRVPRASICRSRTT
ncbi:MAG: hypothetical protein MZV65_05650 [Chromatiales bacterium]|nr:hypothetical protein [Chromatiales bacterium]